MTSYFEATNSTKVKNVAEALSAGLKYKAPVTGSAGFEAEAQKEVDKVQTYANANTCIIVQIQMDGANLKVPADCLNTNTCAGKKNLRTNPAMIYLF